MRVWSEVAYEWNEAKQRYEIDLANSRWTDGYEGPVAELKKGRGEQEQLAANQTQVAKNDQAVQAQNAAKAEPFVTGLESTKPGELSPNASAQYGSDVRNIHDTYGGAMRTGLRMLAYRGLGSAPTGAESSIINTNDRAEGAADTDAYRNALNNTYQQGLAALQYRGDQQNRYNPTPAYSAAGNINAQRAQMGSTLGDIGTGISTLAGAAGKIISPIKI